MDNVSHSSASALWLYIQRWCNIETEICCIGVTSSFCREIFWISLLFLSVTLPSLSTEAIVSLKKLNTSSLILLISNSHDAITGAWGRVWLFELIWTLPLVMIQFIFTCRRGFWVCPGWLSEDSVDWPCCVWWRWGCWHTLAGYLLHSYNPPTASSTKNNKWRRELGQLSQNMVFLNIFTLIQLLKSLNE